MRARYQRGSVTKDSRTGIWHFRWNDRATGKRKSEVLGRFPSKAKAERAADPLRLTINNTPREKVTVAAVVKRFIKDAMPTRFSTRNSYTSYLNNHILPRWRDTPIDAVHAEDFEAWLRGLPLAPKSQQHVKLAMGQLITKAMYWRYIPAGTNPMSLFRLGGVRRRKTPRVLTEAEVSALIATLDDPMMRALVLTDLCLGLRCSELFALKWGDINWEQLTILVQRGIVVGRVAETKTEYSLAPVPMDPALAEVLLEWRRRSNFTQDSDWVWASPFTAGEKPYLGWRLQQNKLRPAAITAGIGPIGWHTFRHTYRAFLKRSGTAMEVQRDLMRHADIRTTQSYGIEQEVNPLQREANSKVVTMVLKRSAG